MLGRLGLAREAAGEGLLVRQRDATALIRPTRRGDRIKIYVESASSEMADELCGSLEEMLQASAKEAHT